MITTVITVTTMAGFGILGMVAVIALAAFLCVRQLAAAGEGSTHRFLARSLEVAIVPLVIVFVMIVAMKIVGILT